MAFDGLFAHAHTQRDFLARQTIDLLHQESFSRARRQAFDDGLQPSQLIAGNGCAFGTGRIGGGAQRIMPENQ